MWFTFLVLVICFIWLLHQIRIKDLPPGPFSLPIIGTLAMFDRSQTVSSIVFHEKFFHYKDFFTLLVGPILNSIVINDFKLAKELFSKDEFSGNYHRTGNC